MQLGWSVEQLQARMGAREFRSWLTFMGERPLPHVQVCMQLAVVGTMLANRYRWKGHRIMKTTDFFLDWDKPIGRRKTAAEIKASMTAWLRSCGAIAVTKTPADAPEA